MLITRQVLNCHHSVMDGRGISTVGKTWARNVGAVSEGRLVSETLTQEKLDRTQAFGNGSRSMEISEFPNYRMTKQVWRSALQRQLWEAEVNGDISHPKRHLLEQLTLTYWNIPHTTVEALKRDASQSAPNAPVVTDSAIISALLWRHITRARRLTSRGVESTCILNVVNIRRRLDPPLSLDYPGNAIAHARTTATPADVESEKTLYELAKQVTDSIDWWTSDRIWGLISAIDSTPRVGKV
jgi:hypothetical protein